MKVKWTVSAHRDLIRLYEFLVALNPQAANKVINTIVAHSGILHEHPYIGSSLELYAPRNVRSLIIGEYELRYEVTKTTIFILRIWHDREQRIR